MHSRSLKFTLRNAKNGLTKYDDTEKIILLGKVVFVCFC